MFSERQLVPRLPRDAWLLLAAEGLAAVGSGMTLPFLLVYLHGVRGLDVELAGLAIACLAAVGFVGNPVAGALIDRTGARRTLTGGLVLVSLGAAALAEGGGPAAAFAAVAVLGLGAAAVVPAQDALLAVLAPDPADRAGAFSVRYATMNLGLGIGSVAGALVADASAPASFRLLFLVQAATMLAFAALVSALRAIPAAVSERAPKAESYRTVMADRPFRRLLVLVSLLVAAGYAQYQVAFPAFATGAGGVPTSLLGIAFAANTFTIVIAQLPVLRIMSRWTRSRGLALVGALWEAAWLVALGAGTLGGGGAAATAGFAGAMVLFGLGETALSPTLGPLVNDLASDAGRGRYNGAYATASTTGFTLGPAVIGILLGAGLEHVALLLLIGTCGVVIVGALRLERWLPREASAVLKVSADAGTLDPVAA